MGHVRLGTLPRTQNWIQVLDLVGGGAGAPDVATATMRAAQRGLEAAAQDKGLVYTVWLLTQVPLAARSADFEGRLRKLGLDVSGAPSLLEVTGAFADAVDAHLRRTGGRTDLGEMAQMAATEAITVLGTPANGNLFDTAAPSARGSLEAFTTTKRFSALATEFFARLSTKYLTYFLSRKLSNYVGPGGRFSGIDGRAEFTRALDLHCHQASRIVEAFAGGWFSKGQFKGPITQTKAGGFVHVALKKLRAELAKGADLRAAAAPAALAASAQDTDVQARLRQRHGQARVLVVEVNEVNRELALAWLGHLGLSADTANDGSEAVQRAQAVAYDLILMDMQMPGKDGLEVTRELKTDPATRHIRIVAFTAFATRGDEAKMRAAGCDGYLPKPIDVKKFGAQVRACLQTAVTRVPI